VSDDATPRLGLPYLAAAQAQKHVTVNEGLGLLDALVQTAVESRTLAAQPASPADGAIYILPASPTGADWSGHAAGTVMRFEAGAWQAIAPTVGWIALVKDAVELVTFSGGAWIGFGALLASLDNLAHLGVNGAADSANRLVVKSAAVLFDHVGAGAQLKLDKASVGDTGSLLLQTNYSGRAEIGLCGDDDLHIKVSTDGSSFTEAMVVKGADGAVGLGVAAPTSRLHIDGCARVKGFAVAGLPSASAEGAGAIAFVTDEAGGATLAFSDGAAWRRVSDRAVVA
jgi:hypothetical protein